jgi:oligosaccharide repeat unit polymerase
MLSTANFAFAGLVAFYPLRLSGAGALTLSFTCLSAGVLLATLALPPGPRGSAPSPVDPRAAYWLAVIMFTLFLVSNAFYWSEVAGTVGLRVAALSPAKLKAAELFGAIDQNSPAFFFRNTILVPVALTLAVYLAPQRWLPKVLLGVFLAIALVQVRRVAIFQAFSASLAVAVITVPRLRQLFLPAAVGFGALMSLSLTLLALFRGLSISFGALLFGYTAGNLSSLQAGLDDYYPRGADHPFEHTLYIFYSLFKYVDPAYAPGSIIKFNPHQPPLPNTYTFLFDYYLDAGVVGLAVFPLIVGLLIGTAYSLAVRRPSFIRLSFFAAVYSATVMSFMNNDWSWFSIPGTALHATIVQLLILGPLTLALAFHQHGARSGGAATPAPSA